MSDSPAANFGNLSVVAFESRKAKEMATLISRYGGVPLVAPAMREVPLEENSAAMGFAAELFAGRLDAVIFMTGVGARALAQVLETRYPREKIVRSLSRIVLVARGPKPGSVLRGWQIPVSVAVPEPYTWREIIRVLDVRPGGLRLEGSRIAIQEYGILNEAFLEELNKRGAQVIRVPVYRWALPEDIGPLRQVLSAIVGGQARVILFTSAVQVQNALRIASESGLRERLLDVLEHCLVCSVGPACTEALLAEGVRVDVEPAHPKMGMLVYEAAKRVSDLFRQEISSRAHPQEGSSPGPDRSSDSQGAARGTQGQRG